MAEMQVVQSYIAKEPSKPKQPSSCNICGNFKRMHDPSHRKSKVHQKKLNDKFCVIRAKMKDIKPNLITIHDGKWHDPTNETIFCYFCSKSIKKHEVFEGLTVEYLGYLRHLTSSEHQTAVINYLKYQFRQEDYKMFCRPQSFLKMFLDNYPDAKRKYLEKLEALNQKDIEKIKEVEAQREELARQVIQEKIYEPMNLHSVSTSYGKTTQQFEEVKKVPPWQLPTKSEGHENSEQSDDKPVIGPTIDTLTKHVLNRKKKNLPSTRLQAYKNKKKTKINKKYLPPFSGVWNKGRTRQLKMSTQNVAEDKNEQQRGLGTGERSHDSSNEGSSEAKKPRKEIPTKKGEFRGAKYDSNGIHKESKMDLCDCLILDCPGCFTPCPKCSSTKCGHECRRNRTWVYDSYEIEGTSITIKNPFAKK